LPANQSVQIADQEAVRNAAAQNPNGADLETIREIAALKQSFLDINSKIHRVTSSAPQIDRVLAATLRTPFSARISGVRLRTTEKIRLPFFRGDTDPAEHVRAFYIALARANLSEGEKDAGSCQLFVETLEGPALNWFSRLPDNSVDSFHDLTTAFLKNYIMFTNQGKTASDLWKLSQSKDQTLRDFMEKFKDVVSKVNVPDTIAIDALMNTLYVHSKFRDDLYRNPTTSLQDAIARSNNFVRMEEDTRAIINKQS